MCKNDAGFSYGLYLTNTKAVSLEWFRRLYLGIYYPRIIPTLAYSYTD